jgi:TfoX/Sxy family transcriptional regulator of competence genes
MKYYSEEETRGLREAIEKEVLGWGGVITKKMFGCPCYWTNKKLFAFMVTKGLVILRLSEDDKTELSKSFETGPFKAANKTMGNWLRVSLDEKDADKVLPYVRKAYEVIFKS